MRCFTVPGVIWSYQLFLDFSNFLECGFEIVKCDLFQYSFRKNMIFFISHHPLLLLLLLSLSGVVPGGAFVPITIGTILTGRDVNRLSARLSATATGVCRLSARLSATATGVSPGELYSSANSAYNANDPLTALSFYDRIPPSPRLWQRGLCSYVCGDYGKAAGQFALDADANGDDGEEALWEFASRMSGGEEKGAEDVLRRVAGRSDLYIRDRRPVIRLAVRCYYDYFILKSMESVSKYISESTDIFYSDLYVGLLYYCQGEEKLSKLYLKRALETEYSERERGRDFMVKTGDLLLRTIDGTVKE